MCRYYYDAWGNHKIEGDKEIGKLNPFRYRGYYYDTEFGLYYLQSRYYDPELGRFISADDVSYIDTESAYGLNLYAYCNDNSVMGYDPSGTWNWGKVRDWFSTITGLANSLGVIIMVGSLIVAACQGKGDLIAEDWNNGCFNPFNMDESVALKSNVFSFYKGEFVVRHDIPNTTSCQIFGSIFLNANEGDNYSGKETLNHEFGHGIQERFLGLFYTSRVAIPSLASFNAGFSKKVYYSLPWERTADYFGGVNRSSGYKKDSIGWSFAELILGEFVIPFYFLFGY